MKRLISSAAVILISGAVFFGCGKSSGSSVGMNSSGGSGSGSVTSTAGSNLGTATFVGTQAPGDVWEVTTTGGSTYMATDETNNALSFSGNIDTLSDGFLSFGTDSLGLGAPGAGLVLFPNGGTPGSGGSFAANPLFLSQQGSCPTSNGTIVAVVVPTANWNSSSNAYDIVPFTVNGSSIVVSPTSYTLTGVATPQGNIDLTCNNGVITGANGNGGTVTGVISGDGVFALDEGNNPDSSESGLIGTLSSASPVAVSSVAASSNTYLGVGYNESTSPTSPGSAILAKLTGTGTGFTAAQFTNPASKTTTSSGGTVTLSGAAQSTNGLLTGNLFTPTSGSAQAGAAVVNPLSNGKYEMFIIVENSATSANTLTFFQQ